MKKVFNLRIECDSPTFVMADKEFCKGLEEVIADEFDEEMEYVKLKAEPCDKDRQIADLEKQLAEKEKTIKEINKAYIETYKREREKEKEIAELKEQLTEEQDFKLAYAHDLDEAKKENNLLKQVLDNLKGYKASDRLVNVVNTFYEPLLEQKIKQTRHQVCEEIREYIHLRESEVKGMDFVLLLQKLDQIEGEGE